MQVFFFFFNDTATTEIYTLSLHDALPILERVTQEAASPLLPQPLASQRLLRPSARGCGSRSEEHTSELQSHLNLVCRLLLEKKKRKACRRSLNPTAPDHHVTVNPVYAGTA